MTVASEVGTSRDTTVTMDFEVQELIAQAKQGDQAAFGKLYRLHVTSVYKYLSYRLRDTAMVEDLTAEVFLRALRKIHTYEYRGIDFSAWLMRIARNILLDHVKSSGNRLEVVGIADGAADTITVPGSDLEVLDRLDREELHGALNKLRPDHQEVLYLRFLQGLSSSETADAMGKTEGAIRVLQFRALKQLLKVMKAQQSEVR
ncbi:MAG: sigma-70 family RNA polymerase sigma factor [Actinomycetota bacterium]